MSKTLKLNNEFGLYIKNEEVFCSSRQISEVFGKRHDNVLKDIRELDCSDGFRLLNFIESSYVNAQAKCQPEYLITKTGFIFLTMQFTGELATRVKEEYATVLGSSVIDDLWSMVTKATSQPKDTGKKSYVYFLQSGLDKRIKIGKANNVEQRVKSINGMNPHEVVLLASIECQSGRKARQLEMRLHERFREYQTNGEWFEPTADLLAFIDGITIGGSND